MSMEALLTHCNVPYKTHGKNISAGWVNTDCPFCGDGAFHNGYNPDGNYFNCWKCGGHQTEATLMKLTKKNYEAVKTLLFKFRIGLSSNNTLRSSKMSQQIEISKAKLDKYTKLGAPMTRAHRKYLKGRGFNVRQLEEMFGLRGTVRHPKYPSRIIMPVLYEGEEVSWVSRSILANPSVRYVNCPKPDEVISMKEVIYNMDNTSSTAIVTEGPIDAMAIGYGGVATLGVKYTQTQLEALRSYSRIFIWFDPDKSGAKGAEKLASELGHNISVEVLESDMDVADTMKYAPDDLKQLKKDILL